VEDGGEYQFLATATGSSTGNVTIKSGGITKALGGGNMDGTGFTVVKQGGKAYLGDALNALALIIGPTPTGQNDIPVIALTSGKLSLNNAGYELDGVATLNGLQAAGNSSYNVFMVGNTGDANERALTLKAGRVLTVPGTNSTDDKHILVVVVDTTAGPGVTGEAASGNKAAAQIVLAAFGCIDVYNSSGDGWTESISNLNHNFYPNSSDTKEATNSLHNTTYNWNATINSSAGGWEAAVE
jgi:hypothetical protein